MSVKRSDLMSFSSSVDILSASSYPLPDPSSLSPQRSIANDLDPNMFYGGLTLDSADETMSSANKRISRKKNPSNKARDHEATEGPRRQRGRPRVLIKDENAAERRRMQIRLAQRAYRSRKEQTISTLNERLAEIDLAVQDMNKSISAFRDEITGSNVVLHHPHILQSLQRLAEKSGALVKLSSGANGSSKTSSDTENARGGELEISSYNTDEIASTSSLPDSSNIPLLADPLPATMGDSRDDLNALYPSTKNLPFGEQSQMQVSYPGGRDDLVSNLLQTASTEIAGMEMTTSFSPFTQIQPSIPRNPSPPSSYSFLEKSFARRLRQHGRERAYRLLSDPRSDPQEILRTFCFSLGFRSRQALLSRFQEVLNRTGSTGRTSMASNSSIQQVAIPPNYHVGNAGTHFTQTRDPALPTDMYPISKFIGPWPFHFAEISHDKKSIDELIVTRGMTGEWFDANDVEGYLNEIGVKVDAQSTFVAVPDSPASLHAETVVGSNDSSPSAEIYTASLYPPSTDPFSSSSLLPQSTIIAPQVDRIQPSGPSIKDDMELDTSIDFLSAMAEPGKSTQSYPQSLPSEDYVLDATAGVSQAVQPDMIPVTPLSFSPDMIKNNAFDDLNLNLNSDTEPNSNNNNKGKRHVLRVLDVENFIERLMKKAVCLGEKTGYRRQDVEDSFRVACFTIF